MHNHSFWFLVCKSIQNYVYTQTNKLKGKKHFMEESTLFLCSSTFTIELTFLSKAVHVFPKWVDDPQMLKDTF